MTEARAVREQSCGLRGLTAQWEDVQKGRLAAEQRGLLEVADELHRLEDRLGRQVANGLAAHHIGSWLPRGLGGVHVARLVALIDDPFRFPGRRCTVGHYLSVADHAAGADWSLGHACPVETWEGPCPGTLLPPRPGTGVRSLWHYAGLHVVDGRSPRKTRGQRADWNPIARTIVLMPGGIAEQIVRLRISPYRELYDATKARLTETRAEEAVAVDRVCGPGLIEGSDVGVSGTGEARAGTEGVSEVSSGPGLRPFQVDAIARKVAAKAFLGDLLTEWKRRLADARVALDAVAGEAA